jgi:hypothetical protein
MFIPMYDMREHTHHQAKKTNSIRSYMLEIIIGVIIFVAIIFFLPRQDIVIPDIEELTVTGTNVSFVIADDAQTDTGTIISADQVDTWLTLADPISTGIIAISSGTNSNDLSDQELRRQIALRILWQAQSGVNQSGTTTSSASQTTSIHTGTAACLSPWWDIVPHGSYVFAYEQRSDDPMTCNVQRRICTDGILGGTYTAPSCKEFQAWLDDSYIRNQLFDRIRGDNNNSTSVSGSNVSSYTMKPIYFTATPSNNYGSYGWYAYPSHGNNYGPYLSSSSVPRFNNFTSISSSSIDTQITPASDQYRSCLTPRGENVAHGDFVKAYQLSRGFTNLACEVQLRPCYDGTLEGKFLFDSCKSYDIAVEDFLDNYYDPDQASLKQMIEVLRSIARDPFAQDTYPQIDLVRLFDSLRTSS